MRQADDAPAAAATVLISSTSFLTAAAAAQFYIYCLSLDHFLLLLLFRFLLQLFVSPTFTFFQKSLVFSFVYVCVYIPSLIGRHSASASSKSYTLRYDMIVSRNQPFV